MNDSYLTPEHYEIAEMNGISRKNAYQRFYEYNMPLELAITKPVVEKTSPWKEFKEIAKEHGICRKTFHSRLEKGMDPYEAATKALSKRGRKKKQIS